MMHHFINKIRVNEPLNLKLIYLNKIHRVLIMIEKNFRNFYLFTRLKSEGKTQNFYCRGPWWHMVAVATYNVFFKRQLYKNISLTNH
ncbi:hypothetical protein HanRHA438_Chr10g0468141 [Helianthus annuus]|nr:hypothetical protein HanRHA438_Chr10g0468141 [Helianthus annuus]